MIVGTVRILSAPNRRDDIANILRSIHGPVLAQPGCLAWRICEELGPEQAVILVDRWESRAALEAHLRSEAYRRILGAIELSSAPPEIHFDTVSSIDVSTLVESQRDPNAQ
jgi:quinol monooxygenase YgiN